MPCTKFVSSKGFTLIEVIVAISILAVLTTLVASEFRTGLRASSAIRSKEDLINRRTTTIAVLDQQLRGAVPMTYWTGEGTERRGHLSLDGDSTSIRFVSRTSFLDGPLSVPRWIELSWEQPFGSRTGWVNVKERRILSPNNDADPQTYWSGKVLETESLKFEYLRRAKNAQPAEWVQSWDMSQEREFPAAVRLSYMHDKTNSVLLVPLETAATSWKGFSFK